ncbi:MAG TPA: hypothetical protein DIT04_13810 [Dysgonomonas sp.]|nr:hypothetical protein [Dysgonomonas sp.]
MRNYILILMVLFAFSCKNNNQNAPQPVQKSDKENTVSIQDTDIVSDTIADEVPVEEPVIQLLSKHELSENDLYTDYDGGNQLADYFLIELIDEDIYDKNKSLAINMMSRDTSLISTEEGILILPYKKGKVELMDNPEDGDDFRKYTYIGEISYLDAYLIRGLYWEDWDYFLIGKNSGERIQTFINMPYLSADGKYIVSLDFDSIEGVAFIELYEVTDDKQVEPVIGMYTKKWIPINTTTSIYWGNDNYLYVPVVHNKDYWAAEGNYKGIDQYIRLRPIGS